MKTTEQYWDSLSKLRRALGAALVLAILFLTAVVTTPPAQAQTQAKEQNQTQAQTKLIDPATKQIIGSYDPIKKVLVFPKRNMAIPRKLIVPVSEKEYELLKQQADEMSGKKLKPKMQQAPSKEVVAQPWDGPVVIVDGCRIDGNLPSGALGGGGGGSDSDNCVGLCWDMREGGARCQGCCRPVSKDACACWEACADFTSTLDR